MLDVQIDLIIFTFTIMKRDLLHQNILSTLPKMNFMSIADSVESTNFVIKPTHTDVLLGRGVGTNRHAGNTNLRRIVSQYVVSSLVCWSSALLGQPARRLASFYYGNQRRSNI